MGWGSKKDPATGRSKRENTRRTTRGKAPERNNGKIVPKGKLAHQRDRKTGKK
jgi:hypothetical protein